MEFKGTQGKWEINKDELPIELLVYGQEQGYRVCTVFDKKNYAFLNNDKINLANAQLIAHAPEMLEMLKDISEAMKGGNMVVTLTDIKQLIQKATTV